MASGTDCRTGWHAPETALHFAETGTTLAVRTDAAYSLLLGASAQYPACRMAHGITLVRPDGTATISSEARVRKMARGADLLVEGELSAAWQGRAIARRHWSVPLRR